jgi:hypothetical protein
MKFLGGQYYDYGLLECDAVYLDGYVPVYQATRRQIPEDQSSQCTPRLAVKIRAVSQI